MENDKIFKDCPCCGGRAKILTADVQRAFPYSVECTACGLQTDSFNSMTEAAMHWNARVEPKPRRF